MYPDGGVKRVAYMLGGKPDRESSVDLARLSTRNESHGRSPSTSYGLGEIETAFPRSKGLKVEHRPILDNHSHSQIEGNTSRAICKELALNTRVVIEPERGP